jgi:hypothetical protein
MVKCCVFFAVRTEFLNVIQIVFGFKGLITFSLSIIAIIGVIFTNNIPRRCLVSSPNTHDQDSNLQKTDSCTAVMKWSLCRYAVANADFVMRTCKQELGTTIPLYVATLLKQDQ